MQCMGTGGCTWRRKIRGKHKQLYCLIEWIWQGKRLCNGKKKSGGHVEGVVDDGNAAVGYRGELDKPLKGDYGIRREREFSRMDRDRQTMQQGRGKDHDERKGREEESGLEFGRRREGLIGSELDQNQNQQESFEARRIRARVHVEGCSEGVLDQAKIIARTTRPSGGKDRHSKVNTAKGPRDRRVRLSVATAIQFYDVQDRLGYDQPSKAVEWLIKKAKHAIDELPPAPPIQYGKPVTTGAAFCGAASSGAVAGGAVGSGSSGYGYSEVLFGGSGSVSVSAFGSMFKEEDAEADAEEEELGEAVGSWRQEERSISEGSKGSEGLGSPCGRIESRAKARERARERTKEKSCGGSPPRSGNTSNLAAQQENTFSFTNLLQSPLNQNALYSPNPPPQQSLHSPQTYSFQQHNQNQNRQIHLQSLFQHTGPLPIQHIPLDRKPNYAPPPSFLHPEATPRSPLLSRSPPRSSMGSFLSSEFNPFSGLSADHFSSFRPPSTIEDHSSHPVRSFPFLSNNNPSFYLSPVSSSSSPPSENLSHILRPSPASFLDYQRHFSSYQPHVPARIHGIDEIDQNLKHHPSPSP